MRALMRCQRLPEDDGACAGDVCCQLPDRTTVRALMRCQRLPEDDGACAGDVCCQLPEKTTVRALVMYDVSGCR